MASEPISKFHLLDKHVDNVDNWLLQPLINHN